MADAANEGAQAYATRANTLGALTDQERKTAAYNALNSVYGPAIAYDPTTAYNASKASVQQQTAPTQVQQASANLQGTQLENTGREQENSFNALNNPIRLQQGQATLAGTQANTQNVQSETAARDTLLPGQVRQQGAALAQTQAQTGLTRAETGKTGIETAAAADELRAQQAGRTRQAAMGLLANLSDVVNQGGDVGSAFDQMAPQIAAMEGVTPDHLTGLRSAIVQDPAGTINKLADGLNAAQLAAAGGTAQGIKAVQFRQQQAIQVNAMKNIAQRTAAIPQAIDQADALLNGVSQSSAIIRKGKEAIPGTKEYQFVQLMHQIQPNLSLTDLQSMKASGLSMGRVTNAEMAAAGQAYANMDLGQDVPTLRANLQRIKQVYGEVNSNLGDDIATVSRTAGGGVHAAAPQAKQQFQQGQVYADAKGNKARYNAGKWEPVQ